MPLVKTLGRKSDFIRLFRYGKRGYGSILRIIGFHRSDTDGPRFAFQLKKKLGGAVVRNRLRRQLKEIAAQLEQHIGVGWDLVILVNPNAVGQRFTRLERDFKKGLRQIGCFRP